MSGRDDLLMLGAVGLVALFLAYKLRQVAPGIISGDNELTRNATNADGEPETAYIGAGVVGTVGAAANEVSGGYLASLGEWLGGRAADVADAVSGVNDRARANPGAERMATAGTAGEGDTGDAWLDYLAAMGGMP